MFGGTLAAGRLTKNPFARKGDEMNARPGIETLLANAHEGAGGAEAAPESAMSPTIETYTPDMPIDAIVRSNSVLSSQSSGAEVRKIILEFRNSEFSVLEGQSVGVIAPGVDAEGLPHSPRLYSISSPSDGEHAGNRTVTLTVQRVPGGICSGFLCDLEKRANVRVTGPYGDTFLMPTDPDARLLMICAGTGSAPMRAFTMARERRVGKKSGGMVQFFDGQRPDSFPYFGPLMRLPSTLLEKHLVFSQLPDGESESLEERMHVEADMIAELLQDPNTHVYISGPREIEEGVERAFTNIVESTGEQWRNLRNILRGSGRYHIETYWMNDAPVKETASVFEHDIRITWADCDPAKIDFRSPLTPRHLLKCKVWPTALGETSVTFRVEGLQYGKVCFEGSFVCVFVNAGAFAKRSPPEDLREVIEARMIGEVG